MDLMPEMNSGASFKDPLKIIDCYIAIPKQGIKSSIWVLSQRGRNVKFQELIFVLSEEVSLNIAKCIRGHKI